ncbi:hypothetical protein [Acidovorax sp. Leaf78]|nr:hypothetical protein [Acidovorax sp. Leaf78]
MIRAVNLYGVRVGTTTHRIWATGGCDAIAQALALGLPATSARRLP